MEITFDKFVKEKDIGQRTELFIECFPNNIGKNLDHYNWKFHSFPTNVNSYEYAAYQNNNVIGYYAAIPYNYLMDGKLFLAGMVCDIMVGKATRGKGIFTKLSNYSIEQLCLDSIDFTTGNPIRSEVIPGHKKAGWDDPFQLPLYGKFISFDSFFRVRGLSKITLFADLILKIWQQLIFLFRNKINDIQIEYYNEKEIRKIVGLEYFYKNLNSEIPNYLCKNIPFIKWRLGAPSRDYSIIVVRKKNEIIAYSISSFMIKENVPCMGILDFAILNGYKKYSSVLLMENEILAKKNNAELILTMIGKNWAKKFSFFINGYIKTPYKFTFIINKISNTLNSEQLNNKKNWHLMWIDFDNL